MSRTTSCSSRASRCTPTTMRSSKAPSLSAFRAAQLIVELCGGAAGPLVDVCGELPQRDPVRVRGARIARVLGIAVPAETVADIFKRLQLQPKRQGADFLCTPPSFRFDLAIEE